MEGITPVSITKYFSDRSYFDIYKMINSIHPSQIWEGVRRRGISDRCNFDIYKMRGRGTCSAY